jgi:hypothetical protein
VSFDDGEVRDDICLDSVRTPVRFDAAAYHSVVEVHYDRSWYRGRLVELIKGSVVWGVAFEDGDRPVHIRGRRGAGAGWPQTEARRWSESQ